MKRRKNARTIVKREIIGNNYDCNHYFEVFTILSNIFITTETHQETPHTNLPSSSNFNQKTIYGLATRVFCTI